MIPVLLFDDLAGDLGPLSDLRASYEQRTGACTAVERWLLHRRLGGVIACDATRELRAVHAAEWGIPVNPTLPEAICVNGRSDIAPADLAALEADGTLHGDDGTVIAARRSGAALQAFVAALRSAANPAAAATPSDAPTRAGTEPTPRAPAEPTPRAARLWRRPWHLLDADTLTARMTADMALILEGWRASAHGTVPSWATLAGKGHAHVHATARIGANVVLDTNAGSIMLDEGCEVRHGAIVMGPAYIGPGTIVAERAHLKARTVLGPQCRAGGEIGSAIFQGFGNKVHDGHLGDALVGEWVNLGAGTVNSNLLNTYGEIAMRLRPSGALERTGRQFMGCIVGDHAKVAIGTRIMTGASIGTGVMWAATAPISGAVDAFQWVTDDGARLYQADKFMHVARTVMERRHIALAPAEEAALRALHAGAVDSGRART